MRAGPHGGIRVAGVELKANDRCGNDASRPVRVHLDGNGNGRLDAGDALLGKAVTAPGGGMALLTLDPPQVIRAGATVSLVAMSSTARGCGSIRKAFRSRRGQVQHRVDRCRRSGPHVGTFVGDYWPAGSPGTCGSHPGALRQWTLSPGACRRLPLSLSGAEAICRLRSSAREARNDSTRRVRVPQNRPLADQPGRSKAAGAGIHRR